MKSYDEFRLDVFLGCLSSYEDNNRFSSDDRVELSKYIKIRDPLFNREVLGRDNFIFTFRNTSGRLDNPLGNVVAEFSFNRWIEVYNYVKSHQDDFSDMENLYQFSHKKARSIRRLRLRDVCLWYQFWGMTPEFLKYDCDYEHAINIAIYFGIIPWGVEEEVKKLWINHIEGWTDKEDFRKRFKKLSNLVKRTKSSNEYLFMIEGNYLTGAQLTKDWFNAKESLESFFPNMKEKRDRGTSTWVQWLKTYRNKMRDVLFIGTKLKERDVIIDFKEFLKFGNWETGGVSENTRVEVDYDGKHYKFKARKNLMKEMADWPDIMWDILTRQEEIMSVIEKEEPGKIRHAFKTGNALYFMFQYLNQFTKKSMGKWPGYVLEEKPNGLFAKGYSKRMLKKYLYDLDFEGFDKQISIDEQVILIGMFFDLGMHNAKLSFEGSNLRTILTWLKFFKMRSMHLLRHVRMKYKGFGYYDEDKNVIEIEVDDIVLWGLLSGLFFTDKVGGGSQKVWREVTLEWLNKCYSSEDYGDYSDEYKGDDTEEESSKYSYLSSHNWFTLGCGFRAAIGKFGIMADGEGEFLRKGIRNESFIGYLCRAIPGFSQMKPWLSEPSDIRETLVAIKEASLTLYFRGGDPKIFDLFFIIVARMLLHYDLDPYIVSVPTILGGMGLVNWDGLHIVDGKVRRGKEKLTINIKNNWTKDIFNRRLDELGIKVKNVDNAVINYLKDKVSSKDIRELNRLEKGSMTYKYKKLKVRKFDGKFFIRNSFFKELRTLIKVWYSVRIDNHWLGRIERLLRKEINLYGKWKHDLSELHILDYFEEEDLEVGKRELLGFSFWQDVDYLTSRGFKKKEASKYLEGHGGVGAITHQNLIKIVELSYAWVIERMYLKFIMMGVKERELIKYCIDYSFYEYVSRRELIRYFQF